MNDLNFHLFIANRQASLIHIFFLLHHFSFFLCFFSIYVSFFCNATFVTGSSDCLNAFDLRKGAEKELTRRSDAEHSIGRCDDSICCSSDGPRLGHHK